MLAMLSCKLMYAWHGMSNAWRRSTMRYNNDDAGACKLRRNFAFSAHSMLLIAI